MDDEPWARTRIATLLNDEPDFTLVHSCTNGAEACKAIAEHVPQVVFLDVQMPDLDGFEVIEAVGLAAMPLVVFVTAYDEYAVRAFEAGALDYLLKPFEEERFRRALDRIRRDVRIPRAGLEGLQRTMAHVRRERRYLQRLVVNSAGRVTFLKVCDLDWLEASGNYVTLHVGRERYLLRETLSALQEKLDPEQFVRIHRSAIVNVERLKELRPWSRGEQVAVLQDGTELTIGRAFRPHLLALMSNAVD